MLAEVREGVKWIVAWLTTESRIKNQYAVEEKFFETKKTKKKLHKLQQKQEENQKSTHEESVRNI